MPKLGGTNQFSSLFQHALHYCDVANNAVNAMLAYANEGINVAGDHLFTQASLCIVGCLTAGLQGDTFYFSISGFSWTFWRKFSAFAGVQMDFNSTGQRQMVKNNTSVGLGSNGLAGVLANVKGGAEGFGGGGGASTYVGPNGPGKIYPYVYGSLGEGWQFSSGRVDTWAWTAPGP